MRTKIYDPSTSWRDSCFSNRLGVAADLRRDHRHQRFARPFWNIDVEEKFPKENFRVNREMRDEILVYESILSKILAKMASKCKENAGKI